MSWIITGREAVPVDPYIGNVSLLLHGDGANGSTTIVDSSPSPKTVTAVGNAQISTAQSKFGGSSLKTVTSPPSYFSVISPSPALDFDTDFTWETWCYRSAAELGGVYSHNNSQFRMFFLSTNAWRIDLGGVNNAISISGIPVATWFHAAVVRSNGFIKAYLNGIGSSSYAYSNYITCATGNIGESAGSYFNGYIDDLRITKGIARYTSNFTPPTAPFPDI